MMRSTLALAALALVTLACARPAPSDARVGRDGPRPGVNGPGASQPGTNNPLPTQPSGGGVRIASTANGTVCGDDLAATTFRFAICTCDDAAFAASVETSAYSSSDPNDAGAGGGLGSNGSISFAGDLDVGGTLAAAGNVSPAGAITVRDDARVGGDLTFVGAGDIGGDAFIGGDLTAIGLAVGGAVHANEGARVIGGGGAEVVREVVTIDPPCACGDDARTDVVGIVAAAAGDNDNAANGIDAAALTDVAGDIELVLPAGRAYFEGVRAAGAIRVEVTGPAAMFVDGDVAFAGLFEVVLTGADASLDLFVNGDLASAGALDIGSATAPSKVRVYVGGDGDIAIAGSAALGASLFAPDARVALAGSFTFDGALVAGSLAQAGALKVRYDADVLDGAGEDCPDAPVETPVDETPPAGEGDNDGDADDGAGDDVDGDDGVDDGVEGDAGDDTGDGADDVDTCDTVADCSNQACVDGVCGACASSLDCAAPLTCIEGACVVIGG